ncbi:hypothetical protein EJK15_02555 [Nonomuraea basaltis]|nr:hypothetical protein EJK15_02555 [Nonomuraea basaltis]
MMLVMMRSMSDDQTGHDHRTAGHDRARGTKGGDAS